MKKTTVENEAIEIEKERAHWRLLRAYNNRIEASDKLPHKWPKSEQDAFYDELKETFTAGNLSEEAEQHCRKELETIRAEWHASAELDAKAVKAVRRKLAEMGRKHFDRHR